MADRPDGNQVNDQLKEAIKQTTAAGGAVAEFVGNLLPKEAPQNSAKPEGSTNGQNGASTPESQSQRQSRSNKAAENSQSADSILPKILGNWLKNDGNSENSIPSDNRNGMKGGQSSEIQERIDRILRRDQVVEANQTGIIELKTGDKLIRAGDNEILLMKGGGALIVKPDGSCEVSSKEPVKIKSDAKSGTTTFEIGNGSVVIQDGKITEVKRDGTTVEFEREKFRMPNRLPDGNLDDLFRPKMFPGHRNKDLDPGFNPKQLDQDRTIPELYKRFMKNLEGPEFKRLDAPNPDGIKRLE